jgi:hypothetical protein
MGMIHTLQDLCYAYRVADPVREMLLVREALFALQDRIAELEAQRKPLTATSIANMMPSQIPSEYDGPLMEFARDIEQAHNIKE